MNPHDHTPVEFRRVFVYGTLRVGGTLHGQLAEYEPFILPAELPGFGLFVDRDVPFPWVHPLPHGTPGVVRGDLLTFSDENIDRVLQHLDYTEGVADGLYRRERVRLQIGSESRGAWIYLAAHESFPRDLERMRPDGDWLREVRERRNGPTFPGAAPLSYSPTVEIVVTSPNGHTYTLTGNWSYGND